GCENPVKCRRKAASTLGNLPPKWNPFLNPAEEINITPNQPTTNQVRFEKDVTTRGNLKEGFRVFTDPIVWSTHPATHQDNEPGQGSHTNTIYTDGSCINNGDEDARAGGGIWYAPGDARNQAYKLPRTVEQSNNTGEAAAILLAIQNEQTDADILIKMD
ncbi:hypothetical protein BD779DRAFT_1405156, partial [Infundibulicybe gibba]